MNAATSQIVMELEEKNSDFEWYPTSSSQIKIITNDIKEISENFDFTNRYSQSIKVLDIGAGDGRVLQEIEATFAESDKFDIASFAIEKASTHTNTYRNKGITLIGTEFNQINFISKQCEIGFVNPPYSEFSHWIQTLISHLNFGILYAIIPRRWEDDPAIKAAMELRNLKYAKIIAESDFLDADRQARAKVHLVRFSFEDLSPENIESKHQDQYYKPTVGRDSSDPFQIFIEQELGLKKTYSETTEKFSEYYERERIRKAMLSEGSTCFELVKSKGILSLSTLIDA